jgi:TfoX/Sxy family transcriptional regulator of competence genes
MAYDEALAGRIRAFLARRQGVTERKMFGGVAFMLRGNMCCGALKKDLVVRVGPEYYPKALARPHVRPMDFTGRPLKGFVYVGPAGYRTDRALTRWIELGADYVASLPKKRRD